LSKVKAFFDISEQGVDRIDESLPDMSKFSRNFDRLLSTCHSIDWDS